VLPDPLHRVLAIWPTRGCTDLLLGSCQQVSRNRVAQNQIHLPGTFLIRQSGSGTIVSSACSQIRPLAVVSTGPFAHEQGCGRERIGRSSWRQPGPMLLRWSPGPGWLSALPLESSLQVNATHCFAGGILIQILAARHFRHGAKWTQEGQERGQFHHGQSVHDFDDSRAGCRDGELREDGHGLGDGGCCCCRGLHAWSRLLSGKGPKISVEFIQGPRLTYALPVSPVSSSTCPTAWLQLKQ